MPTLMKSRPKYTFKLLVGQHIGPDESKETLKTVHPMTGIEVDTKRHPSRTWNAKDPDNNIVETSTDLIAELNGNGKFQLLSGKTSESVAELEAQRREIDAKLAGIRAQVVAPTSNNPDGKPLDNFGTPVGKKPIVGSHVPDHELDNMAVQQLRDYAAENEIDLGDARLKADILDTIKTAS